MYIVSTLRSGARNLTHFCSSLAKPLPIPILLIVVTLAGCGFRPLYKAGGEGVADRAMQEQLAAITVEPIGDRIGQELRTQLREVLNPEAIQPSPQYRLHISLERTNVPLAIQQNREITRFNIVVVAKYQLIAVADNKLVSKGNIKMTGSYDAVESQFATFVAEQDTVNRMMREMAQEFKMRLSAILLRQKNQ